MTDKTIPETGKPIELRRAEVLTLVFERLLDIQSAIAEAEDKGLKYVDNPREALEHLIKEIRKSSRRALELVETLPAGTIDTRRAGRKR